LVIRHSGCFGHLNFGIRHLRRWISRQPGCRKDRWCGARRSTRPALEEPIGMCLGIPGKLVEVYPQDGLPMGKVSFGGILKEVCLAYTPEAQVGQFVLVHVGFAISQIDESEAEEIFTYLAAIGEAGDGAEK
jgi:hydrogenase expression/formation protein HypC